MERIGDPYYKTYFPFVVVAIIIASALLFFPPRKTIAKDKNSATENIVKNNATLEKKEQSKGHTIETQIRSQTIVLMGDIMLSRSIGAWNKKEGYNRAFGIQSGANLSNTGASGITGNTYYNPIDNIANCKNGGCLLFGNLESPLSSNDLDKHEKTMRFRANTGNIEFLTTLRGENNLILTLANNHLNNAGGIGIQTTSKILGEKNIFYVGGGDSKENARKILVYTGKDISRCVGGYSYDGNGGIYGGKPLYRNKVDLTGMLQDLSIMKDDLKCDIKAMMIHWGSEYHINPNKTQISQAHALIDNGLDLLIGSHAHVPGKIEVYSGKYIFYSLGNAMFDQDRGMQAGSTKSMDSIYDEVLGKNTVPTYIAIFPELLVKKTRSGENTQVNTTIRLQGVHGARLQRGIYTGLDEKTLGNVLEKIMDKK